MSVLETVLLLVGYTLLACGIKARLGGNLRGMYGWFACGTALICLRAVIRHREFAASVTAALTAIELWLWWNSGGGDGTRLRLRRWARRFEGRRRTAPAAHTAMTTSAPANLEAAR